MRDEDHAEALRLIEKAVLAILAGRRTMRWITCTRRFAARSGRFPSHAIGRRRPPVPEARARSGKSRYGHPFSRGQSAVAFHGSTAMRGAPPSGDGLTPMPHPENRLPAQVSQELIMMKVWEVIESGARIKISCDNCSHEMVWTRGYMEKKLTKLRGLTMIRLALWLRCGGCRSNYIRVWSG